MCFEMPSHTGALLLACSLFALASSGRQRSQYSISLCAGRAERQSRRALPALVHLTGDMLLRD